jgi:6-pyruvoyl-tetrahydropterin synthase
MIVDFGVLKALMKPVLDALDHKNLNDLDVFTGRPTTAETLSAWIYAALEITIPGDLSMNYITVWETDDSSATVANA